ncbi:hypothetical protein MPER_02858, partial [Moniliophthora perniciosa FA553]
ESEPRLRLVGPILDAFGTLLVLSALEDGIRAMNGLGYGDEIEIGRSIRDEVAQMLDASRISPVLTALYDRRTVDSYVQIRGRLEVARLADEFQDVLVSIRSHLVLLDRAIQGEGDWGVFEWWMREKDDFHCDVMDKLGNDQMWTSKARL